MSAGDGRIDWERFLAEACAQGLSPDEFWHMTPRELAHVFGGAAERQRRTHDLAMTEAWWASHWSLLKNPPSLSDVLNRDAPKPKQDWQAMKAALMAALN